ncbi:MAG: ATP synthase F1 subunit gamma [Clostridia bacterium]|nr:ATP synthase F1 subunit gamma [Clostridia bacterium]
MGNAREILSRINSIKDTMKITNAMYMISSAKVKKARNALQKTEPFFETLKTSLAKMLECIEDEELTNRYFDKREYLSEEERTEGYLVVTADKGLASAYNYNVIKTVEKKIENDDTNMLFVVGEVGRNYFHKRNIKIDEMFHYTAQNPSVNRARAIAETLMGYFSSKKVDEIYVVYTKMNDHGVTSVETEKLLPLENEHIQYEGKYRPHIELYPDNESVIEHLVPTYLSGFVYGALVESFCAENNTRMMAMNNATEAAKSMIKELNTEYNRARQAAITQEISEIVGGANAMKGENL